MSEGPAREGLTVLLTADAVGGVWTWAVDLARGLARSGMRVVLAVLGPGPSPAQRAGLAGLPVDLRVTGTALDWTAGNPADLAASRDAVAAMARECGADLVHLHAPALAAGLALDRPVVVTVHSCLATWWRAVKGDAPFPDDLAWRIAWTRDGLLRADRVLAPSAAFGRAVAQTYGVPAPQVVSNGRPPPPRVLSRRERFAFTAGRLWDEGKNIAAIDRAAAHLDIPVLAAGDVRAPHGEAIAFTALRHLGPLGPDEIAERMGRAAVYVSTARYEPFGLAVLEAAGAGAALVLSDIPVFRELWADAALFVAPDDHLDVASSIDMLMENDALRLRLAQRARRRARDLDGECGVARTRAIYASLPTARAEMVEARA